MDPKKPAPVALFAFNRPEHTRRTLQAIAKNELADSTDVYVFVDGPRNQEDYASIQEVLALIKEQKGFKSLEIFEQASNIGLASNIIQGIHKVFKRHDRIIVLEDDIVTSPVFLRFMNECLEKYESESRVWHISGYNEPTDNHEPEKTYFSRLMNCWGWGTWREMWQNFEKNPSKLATEFTPEMIDAFNLGIGEKYWFQVEANADGRLNTWAIFWYATIFKNEGLCLTPHVSYVRNIGLDGSGVHCDVDEFRQRNQKLNEVVEIEFPKKIEEDERSLILLQRFFLEKRTKKARRRKRLKLSGVISKMRQALFSRIQ